MKFRIFFTILFLSLMVAFAAYYLRKTEVPTPNYVIDPYEQRDVSNTTGVDQRDAETQNNQETVDENDILLMIEPTIYDQLETSDVEVRVTSIAEMPNIWRAFINSDLPLSDPSFLFGCRDYSFTGEQVLLDIFVGEDGRTWVAESTDTQLMAIGEVDDLTYQDFYDALKVNPRAACVLASKRSYMEYHVRATDLDIRQEGDQFVITNFNIPLLFPSELEDSITEARDMVLLGDHVLYLGYDGVETFDVKRWEASLLYDFLWKDLHGVSDFVLSPSGQSVALGVQTWDEEIGTVIVYGQSENEGVFEYGRAQTDLAWQVGVSGIPNLEYASDIAYANETTLSITEYPEFNDMIVNGSYPPDMGRKEVSSWEFMTGASIK